MRRSVVLVAPIAALALTGAAYAGGPDCAKGAHTAAAVAEHKGCTYTKEECLKHMAEARNRGWLGVSYDATDDGANVVKDVVKGSPAEKAGFRAGDILFALNGIEMNEANAERVGTTWKSLKPGSEATYTVKRGGMSKDLKVTLGTMPDAVYQAMVSEHMKEHVDVAAK